MSNKTEPLPYLCREGNNPHPEHTNPNRKYVEHEGITFIEEQDEDYDPIASAWSKMASSIMYNARDLAILANTNDKGRELVKQTAELSGLTEHDVLCYIALYEGAGVDWVEKPVEELVRFVTL